MPMSSDEDFLATLTPVCVTSGGRSGSASATRFCTLTVAMSGSVPTAKLMLRL